MAEILDRFEYGAERVASDDEMDDMLARLRSVQPVAGPGGSALNTMASIAATGADVSIGYIGVRGRSGSPTLSLPDWFASMGIDDSCVIGVMAP